MFKNGRRAKAPFYVFEYDDPATVGEYYEREIKENFTKKLREAKIMIVRSDLPQSRQSESDLEFEKKLQKRKNRVFAKHLKTANVKPFKNTNVVAGLIFCKESNWQWQWAALESGTSRYLAGISPTFTSSLAADEWMKQELENL